MKCADRIVVMPFMALIVRAMNRSTTINVTAYLSKEQFSLSMSFILPHDHAFGVIQKPLAGGADFVGLSPSSGRAFLS